MKLLSQSVRMAPLYANATKKNTFRFATAFSALLLAACGSDNNSSDGGTPPSNDPGTPPAEEHAHVYTTLISVEDSPNLYFLEGEETSFEMLDDAMPGNGSQFVQADSGKAVAVLSDQQVRFVGLEEEEEHEHEEGEEHHGPFVSGLEATGSQVSAMAGHFSVLTDAANSSLAPVADLHDATEFEETIDIANQTAPAHLLDEDTESWLVFTDGQATVYQEGAATDVQIDCTTLSASVTIEGMTLLVCDNTLSALTEADGTWAFNEVETPDIEVSQLQWAGLHDHAFAFIPGTQTIYALHPEETPAELEALELSSELGGDLCYLAIEPEAHELLFAVTNSATALVLEPNAGDEHMYDEAYRIVMDESDPNLACDDLKAGAGPETIVVADNNLGKMYLIDAHQGPYHIHSRIQLPAGMTVADLAVLQEFEGEGDHDHAH